MILGRGGGGGGGAGSYSYIHQLGRVCDVACPLM